MYEAAIPAPEEIKYGEIREEFFEEEEDEYGEEEEKKF